MATQGSQRHESTYRGFQMRCQIGMLGRVLVDTGQGSFGGRGNTEGIYFADADNERC